MSVAGTQLDEAWLHANPLPVHAPDTNKNARGRVLLVGGAEFVPGAIRLTGEATLRCGAGKLQMATVQSVAMALGVLVPEAAMVALPVDENGEIADSAGPLLMERVARVDAMILGPGMSVSPRTGLLMEQLMTAPRHDLSVVLDAAAIICASDMPSLIRAHEGRVVMTPHHGEMALLAGVTAEAVAADPDGVAARIAAHYHAIMVLKSDRTVIALPDGGLLEHCNDCVGLATGGSGDVLAGLIGGLLAQGADPATAAGWGVWLHGAAGRLLSEDMGAVGFLARDLLTAVPRVMMQAGRI